MRVRVGYHGRCFDGCTSAALFTRFYREKIHKDAEILYRPLAHQKGLVLGEKELDGDENAVVDFKYTSSPALTWWFDHHQSAFNTAEQRSHFEADRSGKKFFDPHCSSCTKLIADTVRDRFQHRFPDLEELIHWADIIDAARFDSPAMAVELKEPALRLMTVIEASDDAFCDALIPQLAAKGLDVARSEMVQERFKPLWEDHQRTVERIRQRARYADHVVHFDLTEWPMDGFNKFIGYYVHPEANYSVGVTASERRAKVSVGSNPWAQDKRRHDLAKICEKYGGGGHPAVGAVTLGPGEVAEARRIGEEIAATLRS
ncbi:MAG: phosphoesterase [Myxococcota bacterium]